MANQLLLTLSQASRVVAAAKEESSVIIGTKKYLFAGHGVKDALEEAGFIVEKVDRKHGGHEHWGFGTSLPKESACFVEDWATIHKRVLGSSEFTD